MNTKPHHITPKQALDKLLEGNQRFFSGEALHTHQDEITRRRIASGQHPFAIILGCSDSRVPPELIFDQGLGDLFVVRVAGNLVDSFVLGSIEFALSNFHCPLILVLGHTYCGAVQATVEGENAPGCIADLVNCIHPIVEQVKDLPGDLLENATRAHVKKMATILSESKPIIQPLIQKGKLVVKAGIYDLISGDVTLL
jgi:carbonic anhydrase